MVKILWRTLLILATATSIALLFYHAVNAGWLSPLAFRPVVTVDREGESGFERRFDAPRFRGSETSKSPFTREFGNPEAFEGREFRGRISLARGLGEMGRSLIWILLITAAVVMFQSLIRVASRHLHRQQA